ncbi:hypothetical protein FRC17_008850 [Serendipita sp. 399]|nr:hypothetical protein FRC17_008850 [Serendipita sp. 399]
MSDYQDSLCSLSAYGLYGSVDDEITFVYDHLVSILSEEALLRQRLEQLFQQQEKEADEAIERAKQRRRDIAKAREEMTRNIQRDRRTQEHTTMAPLKGTTPPKVFKIKGKTISVEDAEDDIDYPELLFMTRKERNRTKK